MRFRTYAQTRARLFALPARRLVVRRTNGDTSGEHAHVGYLPWEKPGVKVDEEGSVVTPPKPTRKKVQVDRAEIQTRRASRARSGSGVVAGPLQQLQNKCYFDEEQLKPNYGGLGNGEEHWYALCVASKKEESLGKELASEIRQLPKLRDRSGGRLARHVQSWVPTRKVFRKWKDRVVMRKEKYGNGSWVFLHCVMDNEVHRVLAEHHQVRSYRSVSLKLIRNRYGDELAVPAPLSPEFMSTVDSWANLDPEKLYSTGDQDDQAEFDSREGGLGTAVSSTVAGRGASKQSYQGSRGRDGTADVKGVAALRSSTHDGGLPTWQDLRERAQVVASMDTVDSRAASNSPVLRAGRHAHGTENDDVWGWQEAEHAGGRARGVAGGVDAFSAEPSGRWNAGSTHQLDRKARQQRALSWDDPIVNTGDELSGIWGPGNRDTGTLWMEEPAADERDLHGGQSGRWDWQASGRGQGELHSEGRGVWDIQSDVGSAGQATSAGGGGSGASGHDGGTRAGHVSAASGGADSHAWLGGGQRESQFRQPRGHGWSREGGTGGAHPDGPQAHEAGEQDGRRQVAAHDEVVDAERSVSGNRREGMWGWEVADGLGSGWPDIAGGGTSFRHNGRRQGESRPEPSGRGQGSGVSQPPLPSPAGAPGSDRGSRAAGSTRDGSSSAADTWMEEAAGREDPVQGGSSTAAWWAPGPGQDQSVGDRSAGLDAFAKPAIGDAVSGRDDGPAGSAVDAETGPADERRRRQRGRRGAGAAEQPSEQARAELDANALHSSARRERAMVSEEPDKRWKDSVASGLTSQEGDHVCDAASGSGRRGEGPSTHDPAAAGAVWDVWGPGRNSREDTWSGGEPWEGRDGRAESRRTQRIRERRSGGGGHGKAPRVRQKGGGAERQVDSWDTWGEAKGAWAWLGEDGGPDEARFDRDRPAPGVRGATYGSSASSRGPRRGGRAGGRGSGSEGPAECDGHP